LRRAGLEGLVLRQEGQGKVVGGAGGNSTWTCLGWEFTPANRRLVVEVSTDR
jgi:hypothetical protein